MWKPRARLLRDAAEAGVGTIVIIIALIAVASVTAALVLNNHEFAPRRDSGLRVVEVTLWRENLTDEGWWDIVVNATLGDASEPIPLDRLIIHMSNRTASSDYNYSAATPVRHGEGGRSFFTATWIEGGSADATMEPGDLVSFHFNMNNVNVYRLRAGTHTTLTVLPPDAAPVSADFRAPGLGEGQSMRAR